MPVQQHNKAATVGDRGHPSLRISIKTTYGDVVVLKDHPGSVAFSWRCRCCNTSPKAGHFPLRTESRTAD